MKYKRIKKIYYEVYKGKNFIGYTRKKNSRKFYDSVSDIEVEEDATEAMKNESL